MSNYTNIILKVFLDLYITIAGQLFLAFICLNLESLPEVY